jgi:hypothetical protein
MLPIGLHSARVCPSLTAVSSAAAELHRLFLRPIPYTVATLNGGRFMKAVGIALALGALALSMSVHAVDVCDCKGYSGPGGPCFAGPGGPAYAGPGGPAYSGPGGPCYRGPGSSRYDGPGGAEYRGPGGPRYDGPGGPAYAGVGGACYAGIGGPCYPGPGGDLRNCPSICE